MSVYPKDRNLPDGSVYPGLDIDTGKFTDGDAQRGVKASFFPAETLNFILDNLKELIELGLQRSNPQGGGQAAASIRAHVEQADRVLRAYVDTHADNRANPHRVTKAQVGLGDVPNWRVSSPRGLGGGNRAFASEGEVREAINNAKNAMWPVGAFYAQFPGGSTPSTLGLPGSWAAQFESEGVFFRTSGGRASSYNSGIQRDEFQGHGHRVFNSREEGHDEYYLFYGDRGRADRPQPNSAAASPVSYGYGSPRYGGETRPKNRTFRVWKRIR